MCPLCALGQPWSAAPSPPWAQVDLRGVRVERVREFGQETRAVRLRVAARPDRLVAELLVRLGLELPSVPKLVQNVVEENG